MPSASRNGAQALPVWWHKALRDFWQHRTRSVLVVLAIATGTAAFSAVLSTYAVLVRELDKGYLETNPASATLRTDAIDDALLAAVVSVPGVGDAEARRVLSGRIKAGPAEWRNLRLFVVKDYGNIRINKLLPQEGGWPPAPGEILIERDALQVARAQIGDSVTVRTASGTERSLRVGGSVHDVGQAQARMERIVYGYVSRDTLALLGEDPYLDQLAIAVHDNPFDEAHVRQVALSVEKWLEGQGHPVRRVDVPRPGKHPHADIMGLLLLAQAAFGLFALALSGVLVVNLLHALMARQVRQIGVMKAIGGARSQIARIYVAQALLLGAAALCLAVPAGMLGSRVFCRYMAVFLNFDISSFAVPLWVYLLEGAAALGVPLAAAAYPVAKGTGISVREALADFGISQASFGTTAFDRLLAGIGGRSRPLLLAIRNSFRRRTRLAWTVATLAVGGLFFMSALNFRASLIHTLDRLFASNRYDLTVGFSSLSPTEAVERAVRKTPGVVRAEGWITTEGILPAAAEPAARGGAGGTPNAGASAGLHGGGPGGGDRFSVIALPAASDLVVPDIVEGRRLRQGDTDVLVANSALAAKDPRMKVGHEVGFQMGPQQVSLRVVGVAREPFSPAVAYVPLAYFEKHGHSGVTNSVRLALDKSDPASITAVRARLDTSLEQEGLRATGSASKAERRHGFDEHMLMIYVFLIVMSCILAGVGGLGLMTSMSLNVMERRRELGVLRAIGATPRAVRLIVVAEGAVIGFVSWALATLAAWPVGKAVGDALVTRMFRTPVDFDFEPGGALIWLGVSVFFGAAASFLPAWHASRRPVWEAIRYE